MKAIYLGTCSFCKEYRLIVAGVIQGYQGWLIGFTEETRKGRFCCECLVAAENELSKKTFSSGLISLGALYYLPLSVFNYHRARNLSERMKSIESECEGIDGLEKSMLKYGIKSINDDEIIPNPSRVIPLVFAIVIGFGIIVLLSYLTMTG